MIGDGVYTVSLSVSVEQTSDRVQTMTYNNYERPAL